MWMMGFFSEDTAKYRGLRKSSIRQGDPCPTPTDNSLTPSKNHFCVDILKIMLYHTFKEAKFSTV